MKRILLITAILTMHLGAHAQSIKIDTSKIFNEVDQPPEFPGGMEKFRDYVTSEIKKSVRKDNTPGLVIVASTVEKDGTFTSPQTLKPLNAESDSIAINIISKTPKWKPAIKDGKPVRCKFSIPIVFGAGDPNLPPAVKERKN